MLPNQNGWSLIYSLFGQHSEHFIPHEKPVVTSKLPKSLCRLFDVHYGSMNPDEFQNVCDKVVNDLINFTTDSQALYLKEVTRNQSLSLIWHNQRVGGVTGSLAHSVSHVNIISPPISSLKKSSQKQP